MRSETLVFEHTCSYGAGYFGASVINGKDVSKNMFSKCSCSQRRSALCNIVS
jgi:hypothetical protein